MTFIIRSFILVSKELSYKKTASDLRKIAIDSLEILSVNFLVFYYLIYQTSEVNESLLLNLKNGLKYSYEALYNKDALIFSIIVGVVTFFIAVFIRPKNKVDESTEQTTKQKIINWFHSSSFGFFRRISRSLLSLAITLSLFTFVATTHGYFNDKANYIDFILFVVYVYGYIGASFYLSYDNKKDKDDNVTNVKKALEIIFLTLLSVFSLALLTFIILVTYG